eukprot:TRINITY_DN11492_c0_g1_i5.p1 TRINITY_DN11492_c0_g1~~TRINITY_DN11492_c0_g1_i5.p1  ORF type:complete len:278 (+),score=82.99 TRINITY_DN11492_c0_g1_i5:75-908(+)
MLRSLVGSEMCIRDRTHIRSRFVPALANLVESLGSFERSEHVYAKARDEFEAATTELKSGELPERVAKLQYKVGEAAEYMQQMIDPVVALCKAIRRNKIKIPTEVCKHRSHVELLERFTPLLVQPHVLQALQKLEPGSVPDFYQALEAVVFVCSKCVGLPAKLVKAAQDLELDTRVDRFCEVFKSWESTQKELETVLGSDQAKKHQAEISAIGAEIRQFERVTRDCQKSIGFYHKTLAMGQQLQLEVAECCLQELQLEVQLDLRLQLDPAPNNSQEP